MSTYVLRVWFKPNQEQGYAPFTRAWRELEIDATHTLEDLHEAICAAVERDPERDYEFTTRDKNGIQTRVYVPPDRYAGGPSWPAQEPDEIDRILEEVLSSAPDYAKERFRELREDPPAEGNAAETTIADVEPDDIGALDYVYDPAQGWEHQIELQETHERSVQGEPKLVDEEGAAPGQDPDAAAAEPAGAGGSGWLAPVRTLVSKLKGRTR